MGLDSIWDENGNCLTKKSKGFTARSTGCSCCSYGLCDEKDVREEALNSLHYILRASRYFKWDIRKLIKEANKIMKEKDKE